MSQPILQVEHLKKYFPAGGRKVLRAVDDVSFSVQEGEILGIVGESGCGKTTCGRTAIGLYSKTDGVSLGGHPPDAWCQAPCLLLSGADGLSGPLRLTGPQKQGH